MKRLWKFLRFAAAAGLLLAWLGIVLKGKDATIPGGVIYYATPWLLRALAGLLALLLLRRRTLKWAAAACLLWSAMEGWHSFRLDARPDPSPGGLTASVYNAGRTLESHPETWGALAEGDLTAVVESGDFTAAAWADFAAATQGMEWRRFGGTMLGVRGRILSAESLGVRHLYRCYRCRVSLPGHGEFTVVVADVRSQPWLSRQQSLSGILHAAAGDSRVIVLGDFNTPPESRWYRGWSPALTLANDGPRRGFRETWAYGLPLLTLDQIWTGQGWEATWTEQARHHSDHSRFKAILHRRTPGQS